MMVPAIFLDRDGVIIENRPNYVRDWAEVVFIPTALATLVQLAKLPFPIVIVTNQSVVGRNLISQEKADEINEMVVETVQKAGGRIDGVYMCPHAPDDRCFCRKPKPGLIQQAAQDMGIDLRGSVMVGDALSDIEAGQRAGIGHTALVLTGRGEAQLSLAERGALAPFQVHESLSGAVKTFTDLAHLLKLAAIKTE